MKRKDRSKGILIWVTGVSGSGKTTLANKIKKKIIKKYGPTLVVNGDDLRKIFKLKKYDKNSRLQYSQQYGKFSKFVTNQGINVIFAAVGMFHSIRLWNRKNIKNYFEIFIKTNISKIKKKRKKALYLKKKNQIVGVQIKPELPKNPDVVISNDFNKSLKQLSEELIKKI